MARFRNNANYKNGEKFKVMKLSKPDDVTSLIIFWRRGFCKWQILQDRFTYLIIGNGSSIADAGGSGSDSCTDMLLKRSGVGLGACFC